MKSKYLTIFLLAASLTSVSYGLDKRDSEPSSSTDLSEEVSEAAQKTKEATKEAWRETKETSKEAWEATKEGAKEAYRETKEFFANMSSESKQAWAHTRHALVANEKPDTASKDMTDEQFAHQVRSDRAVAALADIQMTVEDNELILSGVVASEEVREDIVEAAREATDYEVRDELTVREKTMTSSR